MKLTKTANNTIKVTLSYKDWNSIGKKSGWLKKAGFDDGLDTKEGLKNEIREAVNSGAWGRAKELMEQLPSGSQDDALSGADLDMADEFNKPLPEMGNEEVRNFEDNSTDSLSLPSEQTYATPEGGLRGPSGIKVPQDLLASSRRVNKAASSQISR